MMNDEEVNKVIAEYMEFDGEVCVVEGYCFLVRNNANAWEEDSLGAPYTKSLDTLVPVWKNLDLFIFTIHPRSNEADVDYHDYRTEGQTIQQAAAYATAKAILELKDE